MYTTKFFHYGASLAIHIPDELAYADANLDLEVYRIGDEIRIRPVRHTMSTVLKRFAEFGPDFMNEDRSDQEQADRMP
jgi:antitoxin VapB